MTPFFQRAAAYGPGCCVADQPVILGWRLRPLSNGHSLLLHACASPFSCPDSPLELRDFFTSIFICAHPWRQSERLLRSRWLPFYFRVWHFLQRRTALNPELRKFQAWWTEQNETPAFKLPERSGDARPSSAPRTFIRLAFLMGELHLPEAEALDMPVVRANALYATWLDWTGKAELLTHSPHLNSAFWRFAMEKDREKFNEDGTRKGEQASRPAGQQVGGGTA